MNRQTIIVIVSILVDALQNIYFCAVFFKGLYYNASDYF